MYIIPECSLDSEKFCVRSAQKMGFVGPQYIYQRESGGYKFHALAYKFAALHRMSTVEFVCLEHFAPLWFDSNLLVTLSHLHWKFPCDTHVISSSFQQTLLYNWGRIAWRILTRVCVGGYEKPGLSTVVIRHRSVITRSDTSLFFADTSFRNDRCGRRMTF